MGLFRENVFGAVIVNAAEHSPILNLSWSSSTTTTKNKEDQLRSTLVSTYVDLYEEAIRTSTITPVFFEIGYVS